MALALVLPCLVFAQPAVSQGLEATAVAERQGDFGRLTLSFRDRLDLPPYELTAENGVLQIVFDEPVQTDIRDTMRVLTGFVTIARQDPDGRAMRFGLSRSVRINTMEAGEILFIDFLPPTWQGFPPPLPEEVVDQLAQRAQQAAREAAEAERRRLLGELQPRVELAIGQSPTFVRYSYNWNVPFNVAVTQAGPQLRMEFDYDVDIELAPAFVDQPEELENLTYERDGASLLITMDVRPGTGLRWFEDENRFIVDMDRQADQEADGIEQAQVDRALAQLRPQRESDAAQFGTPGDREDAVIVPDVPDQVVASERPLDPARIGREANDVDAANDTETADDGLRQSSQDLDALAQRPDVASAPVLQVGRSPEVSPTVADDNPDVVRVEVRQDGDAARILFPFDNPTPAAAFRRENYVTLVFQSAIPFDLRSLRLELNDLVRSVRPTRVNDLNMIHLELRDGALLSVAPSGNRWVVILGPSILEPPIGLAVERGTFPDGKAFAEVLGDGFGTPRRIVHPHVGDTLLVIPMLGPTQGALARQEFVEFDMMPSAQGLVLRPKIDLLELDVEPSRVVVSREQGLTLSETGLSLGSFGFSPEERPGYFDLRAYKAEGAAGFETLYADYQNVIALADGATYTEQLLDFSRFLLAYGLGQEANGALDVALSESPSIEHDEAYLTIRAAALTLANRYEEAVAITRSHALEGVEDARFWELLSNAGLGNWPDVNDVFDSTSLLFDSYPGGLVARARLAGVEAALEVGDVDIATARLAQVDPSRLLNGPNANRLNLLQGRVELAKGRLHSALNAFDDIRDADEGATGAAAALDAIEARITFEELPLDEGLEQLENLAIAWRGDDTEVRARILLGELYIAQERYADALTALKGVLTAQPDHRFANEVSDQMQGIFVDLFLNGEADHLAAIDALSLFYDFRELTPIGRRGDELVRRLTDRLVAIDLLDQAADLLEHQVENRLTGTAKAQIAADLALIYLMDYRPAEAVAVLQRSRVSRVPMAIERGRRVIEARALSELGRHELALEVLRDMEGSDIAAVRADVLWNAERWDDAGTVIERTLGSRWQDRVPLDEEEMHQVLRAAIAFSFASDNFALQRLRARFDAKMSDGVFASAFDVVTAPIEAHGSAFRDVARSIAGLNTLNRFLSDYRASFSSQPIMTPTSGA